MFDSSDYENNVFDFSFGLSVVVLVKRVGQSEKENF